MIGEEEEKEGKLGRKYEKKSYDFSMEDKSRMFFSKGESGKVKEKDPIKERRTPERCENFFCRFWQPGVPISLRKVKFNQSYQQYLCQSCHKAFKKMQYCQFCLQLYVDEQDDDGKEWIQCANHTCKKWVNLFQKKTGKFFKDAY